MFCDDLGKCFICIKFIKCIVEVSSEFIIKVYSKHFRFMILEVSISVSIIVNDIEIYGGWALMLRFKSFEKHSLDVIHFKYKTRVIKIVYDEQWFLEFIYKMCAMCDSLEKL